MRDPFEKRVEGEGKDDVRGKGNGDNNWKLGLHLCIPARYKVSHGILRTSDARPRNRRSKAVEIRRGLYGCHHDRSEHGLKDRRCDQSGAKRRGTPYPYSGTGAEGDKGETYDEGNEDVCGLHVAGAGEMVHDYLGNCTTLDYIFVSEGAEAESRIQNHKKWDTSDHCPVDTKCKRREGGRGRRGE